MESSEEAMLANLSKQGGAGFVALLSLAKAGDKAAAEEIHDMAWEQLHSGPWHAVNVVWRDAYTLSSFHMASCAEQEGRYEEALKHLDMGLLMGGQLFRDRLESFIVAIQSSLTTTNGDSSTSFSRHGNSQGVQPTTSQSEGSTKEAIDVVNNLARKHVAKVERYPATGTKKRKDRPSGDEFLVNDISEGFVTMEDAELSERCKLDAYAEVIQQLPQGSLCHADIDERSIPSLETFARDFLLPRVPVVIKNGISHWPAMQKWKDKEYLLNVAGNRTVPVEIGENYLAPGWKQELMTVGELLTRSNASNAATSTTRPYLAQHALFDQNCRFQS